MQQRAIGPLEVGVVGLGCNNFGGRLDAAGTTAVVGAAVDHGITLFDTADVYGDGLSEEYLGAALGPRRDEVVIATKFGMEMPDGSGASPTWIATAVENSLRRLGTDHIDLYQLHRPDPETPIADTLGALHRLVEAGTVRAVGVSNVDVAGIEEGLSASEAAGLASWVSVQNQYSVLNRGPEEDGVLEACERHGIGFLPFFPLESGVLTGKYRAGEPPPEGSRLAGFGPDRSARFLNDESLAAAERLERFAADHGHALVDLAFSYLLAQGVVSSVIAGATSPDQVASNVAAASWAMSATEVAEARRLAAG